MGRTRIAIQSKFPVQSPPSREPSGCPPVRYSPSMSLPPTMRAVVYNRYGTPEVLRIVEVPTPSPAEGKVLVKVAATSVNLSDWESLIGSPGYIRFDGLIRPRRRILGSDISGVVVDLGERVTRFTPGDEVYGSSPKGGFAEYAVASATALALKPPSLTFAQASAIPEAGAIALQGTASVQTGQRFLINGAGGGSGSFAIQLAKRAGAHLVAVDNGAKLEFMKVLGADEVVDYRHEDFTKLEPFDQILDLAARRSVFAYRRALVKGGRYMYVGGTLRGLLRIVTVGSVVGRMSGRRIGLLMVRLGPSGFEQLTKRCVTGEIDIHIHRRFTLEEVPKALAEVGEGRALGKVVVEIA